MLIPFLNIRIVRRQHETRLSQILPLLVALVAAFLLSAFLVWASGSNVKVAFIALWEGAFGNLRQITETLNKAAPLILTGLAAAISFRAKIWNIGAEGQLLFGAVATYWAITTFPNLPAVPMFIVILLASFLAGGLLGLISGYLKTRFNVDVIISTVMFNYIIAFLLSMLVDTIYRDPTSYYKWSPKIPEVAQFPILLEKYRLHAGIIVAIVAAVVIYLLIEKSPLGYEIQAIGHNPTAANFKGINKSRMLLFVMFISGGVAGMAGGGELAGLIHRLRIDFSPGYGFTGIIVAMLAGLNPIWVPFTAVLFGALLTGSLKMQIVAGIPVALVYAIQAIILLFVITAEFFTLYEIRRERNV